MPDSTVLTTEQQTAYDRVEDWVLASIRTGASKPLTLGGYAGTGKTTLVKHLLTGPLTNAIVLAPTGKACQVLRRKGVPANTIHSLLYKPVEDSKGRLTFIRKPVDLDGEKLVIDESSMISREVYEDLLSLNARILFVGDHGQLEPVGDDPGIMKSPDIRLETIMRQALDSPITALAHAARTGQKPTITDVSDPDNDSYLIVDPNAPSAALTTCYDQTICLTNNTRIELNSERLKLERAKNGYPPPREQVVCKGDKIICLRNGWTAGVMNGQTLDVLGAWVSRDGLVVDIEAVDDSGRNLTVHAIAAQFGNKANLGREAKALSYRTKTTIGLFDYGWVITCHKSQGSEWESVLVVEEPIYYGSWDMNRWRYTAITRASKRLRYYAPGLRHAG
jgi:exodeoxyribonuclease-5